MLSDLRCRRREDRGSLESASARNATTCYILRSTIYELRSIVIIISHCTDCYKIKEICEHVFLRLNIYLQMCSWAISSSWIPLIVRNISATDISLCEKTTRFRILKDIWYLPGNFCVTSNLLLKSLCKKCYSALELKFQVLSDRTLFISRSFYN